MKFTISILLILTSRLLFAQELVGMELSNCDPNANPEFIFTNRLISKNIVNDTLQLELGLVRNCSFEPRIVLDRRGDSLIIEIHNVSEELMSCLCCFEMTIKAIGINDTSFLLIQRYFYEDFTNDGFKKLEAYTEIKTYPNKFIFPSITEIEKAGPDNLTINDSLKTGFWHITDTVTNSIKAKALYFIDDTGKSRTKWYAVFNKEGEIIEVCAFTSVDSDGTSSVTCTNKEQYLKLDILEP